LLVRLGDLYMRSGKAVSAEENYVEAWSNLSRNESDIDLRDRLFNSPVRVAGRQLSSLAYTSGVRNRDSDALSQGHVLISYTVMSDGRTAHLQIVESDPPGLMDKPLLSTFSRSLFRARRVDGAAVDTERQLYQLDFKYPTGKDATRSRKTKDPDADQEKEKQQNDRGKLSYPGKPGD
jgi:hypothetical protein